MNLRMPVGIDDFKEVREKYYFVDKTPFIQKLLLEHSKVTLFTRPRRFGKTLTMSMLKYFFAWEDAKDSEKLFAGLTVSTAVSYTHLDVYKRQRRAPCGHVD